VVVLHDGEQVELSVNAQGTRLFLLCAADGAPFNRDIGAAMTLHYADGTEQTVESGNIENYEKWDSWGFAERSHFGRAFKCTANWDGATTLVRIIELPLKAMPLASLSLKDMGKGHRLAILAASVESAEPARGDAAATRCDLSMTASWIRGSEGITTSGDTVISKGPATYHVDVPAGMYRVDLELSGSGNGLFEVRLNGEPASTPWTLSRGCIDPQGSPYERVSLWGRAGDAGLAIALQTTPGKGLWRHHVIGNQEYSLRYLAVTPATIPPQVAPPVDTVTFGWTKLPADHFTSARTPMSWHDGPAGAGGRTIAVDGPAELRVDLAPGEYEVTLCASSLNTRLPRVGWFTPADVRVTLNDGSSAVLVGPSEQGVSEMRMRAMVGADGLVLAFEPLKAGEAWGVSHLKFHRLK